MLSGERLHQWVGARYDVARADGSDTSRFPRQQILVRRLIEDGFDFTRVMADRALVSMTGENALAELRHVTADWHYTTMDDVWPATLDGKAVLVRRPRSAPPPARSARPAWRQTLAALGAAVRWRR